MRLEYETLVAALLGCLGVASFLLLGQLLVPVASPFVPALLGLYATASMFFATRSLYHERTRERFDVTAPTVLENGVLVLRSPRDKCAAFFAFAFHLGAVDTERVRRTLTTLLKVLPHSSVLSIEMTNQNECLASFYVKLKRGDVLQRTRELLGSGLSGFRALFGHNDVRALCDNELLRHLALGIPGRIQRVGRSGRHAAFIQTDVAKCWLSAGTTAHFQPDLLQAIDTQSDRKSETYRVIFAVKNEEQRTVAFGSKLIVSTTCDRPHSGESFLPLRATGVRRMRASEITWKLGDIMTRNVFAGDETHESFEKGVDQLLTVLALRSTRQSDTGIGTTFHETANPTAVDPKEWRTVLFATAQELGLEFETDIPLWNKGFPLRVDGRVGSILFKIVPDCGGDHTKLQWLMDQLAPAMASETGSSIALLPSNASDASALREILTRMPARDRIQSLTSVVQLQALLKGCRAASERAADTPPEAVQKML